MKYHMTFSTLCSMAILFATPSVTAQTQPPKNSDWQLTHISGVAQIDPTRTIISISEDLTAHGNSGCNSFKAAFSDGYQPATITRMQCREALMRQEQAFLEALTNARDFDAQPDSLQLRDEEGNSLARFSPRALPRYHFDCNGQSMFIELIHNHGVRLHYNEQIQLLEKTPADFGTRYRHPEQRIVFLGRGDHAFLEHNNEKTRCDLIPAPRTP